LGEIGFSPFSIILGFSLLILLLLVHATLRRILRDRVFPRFHMSKGVSNAYSTLLGYGVLIIGLLIIIPFTFEGINWATLSVMLGALSLGIGFGLQNVVDNFISGLIILLERPIKVGDRIQISDVDGDVVDIKSRCTIVRTNNNIEIIVPNSKFISEQVINWTNIDRRIRFKIPVGVHYKSDVRVVEKALVEAARQSSNVLEDPPPSAKFMEFGDSSLNFEVWVWTESMTERPRAFFSEINFLIWDKLKEYNIEIPYPQRDVYLKEAPKLKHYLEQEPD
jgi:small-conductance mechanosensitive channel